MSMLGCQVWLNGLLDGRVGVGRREEPPRYESGFRAHGSNQQFHRLLRHAVARALTTAPSLAGVSPAAADILIRHRWRRKGRPGRCRVIPAWRVAAVEISNEPAVSALGVTAERDGRGQLIVAVGDIHTAESFPDSLASKR